MPNPLLLLRHMTHATLLSAAVGLSAADAATANPLLTESTLPFHYPRFDLIKNAHFLPAYEAGMAAQLAEVAAIASATAAPTFDNTVVALERSGSLLRRVGTVFSNLSGAHTNPEMQQVQRTLSPQLAAHSDAIRLNPALFARLSSLYDRRGTLGLDPEWVSVASLGYGNAPAHDHEEEHAHGDEEIPHEADGAFVADDVVTARLMARNRINDFHSVTAGTSWAGGTNGFGGDPDIEMPCLFRHPLAVFRQSLPMENQAG